MCCEQHCLNHCRCKRSRKSLRTRNSNSEMNTERRYDSSSILECKKYVTPISYPSSRISKICLKIPHLISTIFHLSFHTRFHMLKNMEPGKAETFHVLHVVSYL